MIVAALKWGNKIYALPAPARHSHVLDYIAQTHPDEPWPIDGEEGFIDSNKGFVGREKAANIALDVRQIAKLEAPPWLFSEDLW